jgi:hypothetical protein
MVLRVLSLGLKRNLIYRGSVVFPGCLDSQSHIVEEEKKKERKKEFHRVAENPPDGIVGVPGKRKRALNKPKEPIAFHFLIILAYQSHG